MPMEGANNRNGPLSVGKIHNKVGKSYPDLVAYMLAANGVQEVGICF